MVELHANGERSYRGNWRKGTVRGVADEFNVHIWLISTVHMRAVSNHRTCRKQSGSHSTSTSIQVILNKNYISFILWLWYIYYQNQPTGEEESVYFILQVIIIHRHLTKKEQKLKEGAWRGKQTMNEIGSLAFSQGFLSLSSYSAGHHSGRDTNHSKLGLFTSIIS